VNVDVCFATTGLQASCILRLDEHFSRLVAELSRTETAPRTLGTRARGERFMEIIARWIPACVRSAAAKAVATLVPMSRAAPLPFSIPRSLAFVRDVKGSEQVTSEPRGNEKRTRPMTASAPDASVSADCQDHITHLIPAAERTFEYPASEVSGQPLALPLPERFHSAYREDLQQLLAARETRAIGQRIDLAGLRRGAVESPLRLSVSSWEMGDETFFAGIRQDLIEGEQAKKVRGLLEAAPDAIVVADQDGKIVLVNAQMEGLFGYRREEVLGQELEMLMPPRFRERYAGHRTGFSAEPRVRPIDAGLQLFGLHKDGHEFPVAISFSPLEMGDGVLVSITIRDITERKRAEEALKQSEEGFRLLVEGVKEYAIFALTPSGHVAGWNLGAERIKGYRADEIIGRHFSCFYSEKDIRNGKPEQELRRAISQGSCEEEGWRVRKDGSEFWASVVITAQWDSAGHLQGFSKVSRDISERKRAADTIQDLSREMERRNTELMVVNKELESFSYSVSHDLRAPLRSIDRFSLALLEDCQDRLGPEEREHLQRVRAATVQMGELIDHTLALARTAGCEMLRQMVDLSRLALEIAFQLQESEPNRHATFVIPPGLTVEGDGSLLRIVLENLLGNAWKFTSKQPETHLEFGISSRETRKTYFVRDNGIGFDMNYADKLFGAFQRLHDARQFPGSGVGLATVQRIVHRHGGRIWAESAVGQGATFYFTLG
jgi:PAS domain S-box-containing protein